MFRLLSLVAIIMVSATIAQAQAPKFGHISASNIIQDLPEAAIADSLLVVYRDSMIKAGQVRTDSFGVKYQSFMTLYESGQLTPVQSEQGQAALEAEYKELQALEQQIEQNLTVRRDQVLEPILRKLDATIQEIGKTNGYTFIFDSSVMNVILFATESDDIEPLVRTKLGIK
jgi:outer membrane protein